MLGETVFITAQSTLTRGALGAFAGTTFGAALGGPPFASAAKAGLGAGGAGASFGAAVLATDAAPSVAAAFGTAGSPSGSDNPGGGTGTDLGMLCKIVSWCGRGAGGVAASLVSLVLVSAVPAGVAVERSSGDIFCNNFWRPGNLQNLTQF